MMPKNYDLCVIGLGYIGLPTACIFATKGLSVLGVDINRSILDVVSKGKSHFSESDLDVLVNASVSSGKLQVNHEPARADVYVLAVPTPFKSNGNQYPEPDMQYVQAAARSIAPFLEENNLLILESTSPVGTTERIKEWVFLERESMDLPKLQHLHIAHCPERILPGQMLKELVSNDRIVGGLTPEASSLAAKFYRKICSAKIIETTARTAELTKLSENAYRDVNIAFANELSLICEHMDINVWDVIKLANHHPRVNVHHPGPGVGGHCIAIDPWFIVDSCSEHSRLIRTARKVNIGKTQHVVQRILQTANRFKNPMVACLGITYKPDVGDMRESPSLAIVEKISSQPDIDICVVEPHVSELPAELVQRGVIKQPLSRAVREADIIVCLVKHQEFLSLQRSECIEHIVIDVAGFFET